MDMIREMLDRYPRLCGIILGAALHPLLLQLVAIR
jgi:hypothetical protein